MLQSEKDSKIIKSNIKLTHNIGLKVVAEGGEDIKQFELLQDYKIELIQGYYISKPVNYDDIMLLIQSIGPPEE